MRAPTFDVWASIQAMLMIKTGNKPHSREHFQTVKLHRPNDHFRYPVNGRQSMRVIKFEGQSFLSQLLSLTRRCAQCLDATPCERSFAFDLIDTFSSVYCQSSASVACDEVAALELTFIECKSTRHTFHRVKCMQRHSLTRFKLKIGWKERKHIWIVSFNWEPM